MDIYAEITNRIIAEMEQGTIPWKKPWVGSGNAISYATGKPYSILNPTPSSIRCFLENPVNT